MWRRESIESARPASTSESRPGWFAPARINSRIRSRLAAVWLGEAGRRRMEEGDRGPLAPVSEERPWWEKARAVGEERWLCCELARACDGLEGPAKEGLLL